MLNKRGIRRAAQEIADEWGFSIEEAEDRLTDIMSSIDNGVLSIDAIPIPGMTFGFTASESTRDHEADNSHTIDDES